MSSTLDDLDFSGAVTLREPMIEASVDIDGIQFSIWSVGSYYSEYSGRFLKELEVGAGGKRIVIPHDWLLGNTTSWRDYTPDEPEWGLPEPGEPWSEVWKVAAVRASLDGLSNHERLVIMGGQG